MSNQFKPGDLALVIAGGFLGQALELIRFVQPGETVVSPTGKIYEFRPKAGIGGWLCASDSEMVIKHEKNLIPLRGDFSPEQQKAKESEPA
ncbi:hypothetical protein ACTAB2_05600 [Pseudomonas syringae]|uniref:hypothetical protein n=1 Tax=Pseudomonas syringae TaxID=317 RepID=UPI003F78D945